MNQIRASAPGPRAFARFRAPPLLVLVALAALAGASTMVRAEGNSTAGLPECADTVDNDLDGAIDFPADGDCTSAADDSEAQLPQCADAVDNDDDGQVDFPADAGCVSRVDDSEASPGSMPAPDRARIVLAIASAGSLNRDACGTFTGGDGSLECPGADVSASTCASPGAGD